MNCGCDSKIYKIRKPRSTVSRTKWKWGGCSHNLRYGIKFSKLFLDSRERAEDMQSKINLHNNQVGRIVSTYSFSFFFNYICLIINQTFGMIHFMTLEIKIILNLKFLLLLVL